MVKKNLLFLFFIFCKTPLVSLFQFHLCFGSGNRILLDYFYSFFFLFLLSFFWLINHPKTRYNTKSAKKSILTLKIISAKIPKCVSFGQQWFWSEVNKEKSKSKGKVKKGDFWWKKRIAYAILLEKYSK